MLDRNHAGILHLNWCSTVCRYDLWQTRDNPGGQNGKQLGYARIRQTGPFASISIL